MYKFVDVVTDQYGNVKNGVSVVVTAYPSGAATIYSDDGITTITNSTVNTDNSGTYYFFSNPGRYYLTGSYGGSQVFLKDVTIPEAASSVASSANALTSATTTVNVSAATAPTIGQVLTAVDSTHATWQTPAAPPTSNDFGTVAVSGQSNVVAGSSSDTLTLASGSNITITTNAVNKTVTIADNIVGYTTVTGNNTALGTSSGTALTSGLRDTFIGSRAGLNATTGVDLVLIGYNAGSSITTLGNCVAVGQSALSGNMNTSLGDNVAIGNFTMQGNGSGRENVALGNNAGNQVTNGIRNTFLGHSAGASLTTGNDNLIAGRTAGSTLTTGSSNVLLGDGSNVDSAAASNRVALGTNALCKADNSIQLGDSNINLISINGDGSTTKNITLSRNTTSNTAGNTLNINAGSATSGSTDKTGGVAAIVAGLGTGNALTASVQLQGPNLNTSTGTTDQANINRLVAGHSKIVSNNVAKNFYNITLANGTSAGGTLNYGVEVYDGTNMQIEVGSIVFSAICSNAGSVTNNTVTKFGNQQAVTSGTLTVTWAMSAATPSVLSVTVASSLTPNTGYPRVSTSLFNCTNQAITRDAT